jgi:RimJ/RimL family protein N-acetyltransferase
VQHLIARDAAGECAAFSALDRSSGRWAALLRFEPRVGSSDSAEIGLWSHPDFWGAGHGEEVTTLALERTWAGSALETVLACARPGHRASLRLLERCGLRPDGVEWRAHENGTSVMLVRMALTRARWAASRQAPDPSCESVATGP